MDNAKLKQKQYLMDEKEAYRLGQRLGHMDVFKSIQMAKNNLGNKQKQLTHGYYVLLIGTIRDFSLRPSSTKFKSDIVEDYLSSAVLYQNIAQLAEKRKEFAVIEDDFGQTLEQMLKASSTPSFHNLVNACSKLDKAGYIELHRTKSEQTYTYFTERGVDEDEAQACAFAIAFYTGVYSWIVSMEANLFARRTHSDALTNVDVVKIDDDTALIMYYLIKGLSHIQFYWGVVKRYVRLNEQELADYKPGELVTWLQFSSAERSDKPPHWFKERNTVFTIFSLTGRNIRHFSNCAEEEDEVLFLPHSTFLVCHTEYDSTSQKHHIHLRQIELGLCKYVVMWVDDHIFDEQWENKRHMEKASTLGVHVNVHFIPKSNTGSAIEFLRSEFGQRLKGSGCFRIVTDMKRANEVESPSNAGARLLYGVRKLGFNHPCLIFTGREDKVQEKMRQVFVDREPCGIKVTEHVEELDNFVLFK